MKIRTFLNILLGQCAILFLISCGGDSETDGPTLSVNPMAITLEADGTGQSISVSSNTSWTAVPRDSWLKCSPAGGTGGKNITVSADINTGDERSTKLILSDKTGRVTAEVRITQKKGDSPTPTPNPDQTLSVNPSSLNFNSSAGSNTFTIESNTSWTVRSDQTWCTVNTSSGSNNATITVKVSENTSTLARSAIINVGYGNNSAIISVNQEAAKDYLTVSTTSVSFTCNAGGNKITINSNTSWKTSSSEKWLTVSPSQGTGNGTLTLTVTDNTSNSERNALVTIDYGDTNATIAVTQEASYSENRIGTDINCTLYGVSFKMIGIDRTSFDMGATDEQGDDASKDESPSGEVILESYYISETEVTQELWQAVMGFNPSWFFGLKRPVENVSWNDCQEFIIKLNELTGQRFRLPTEAEWECAARGAHDYRGGYFKYAGSNTINDVAWYNDNSNGETHDVALKSPNEIGLYDMSGNVEEWCQDWYGEYDLHVGRGELNPTGPSSGNYRVIRGGSFSIWANYCRVSARSYYEPDRKYYWTGLRLAR